MITKNKINAKVSESKKRLLKEIVDLINKNNTLMIVSITNVPNFQFQKIKHSLKDKLTIKVIKKTLAIKALEVAKETKKDIDKLEKFIESNVALIFSNMDAFEIASILAENKSKAKIKPGQIATQDIIVEAGPTELPAGPAITELSKAKIKAGIEGGKVVIKERCVVTKAGEKVSEDVANALAKLEIEPLSIGLEPIAAYDSKESKVYSNIKIDKESVVKELKELSLKALSLSIYVSYPTKENIKILLQKANTQANMLLNLIK